MEKQQHQQLKDQVSRFWKVSQIVSYMLAFAGSVTAGVAMGYSVKRFKDRCPLYTDNATASLMLSNQSTWTTVGGLYVTGLHIVGGDDASLWHASSTCDFATFIPISGAVYAFILAYFIAMCDRPEKSRRGCRSHNRMSGMLIPILLMSLLFTILMLVASVRTLNGVQIFCSSVYNSLSKRCSEVQNYPWIEYPLAEKFYDILLTAVISSWVGTASFLVSVVLLIARCFSGVDYKIATSPKPSAATTPRQVRRRRLHVTIQPSPQTPATLGEPSPSGNVRSRRHRRRARQLKTDDSPLIDSCSESSRSPSPPPSPLFDSSDCSPDLRHRRERTPQEPLVTSSPVNTPGGNTTTTEAQIVIT